MCKKDVVLDGLNIFSESDVHRYLADLLDFGPYYGSNLDALWDRLSTDVERPVKITWVHSELSRQRLGDRFDKIIQVFERTKNQDIDFSWEDKFDYVLE